MQITILGCGTSTGVPLIGCKCSVCRSRHPKNKRTRASIWVKTQGKSFLIDTSTDLRQQALREKILHVDAVLYTHPHADHINGIDEMRSYNFLQGGQTIPIYGNEWTIDDLIRRFPYIFQPTVVEGGGIPLIEPHIIDNKDQKIAPHGIPISVLRLKHGSKECLGYRFGEFAYLTDCNEIPSSEMDRLGGLKVLILDCLRITPHNTHLNLEKALEVIDKLRPKRSILTHMGHEFDYPKWTAKKLPKGVELAFDGLKFNMPDRFQ